MAIRQTYKIGADATLKCHLPPQYEIISLPSIKYYKSTYNARHPTTEREQENYKHRATALIDDCQGRKEDCKQRT